MKKNGITIKCRKCSKPKYIAGSRIGKRFYCSFECSKADNFGFKPYEKKCIICDKKFLVEIGLKAHKQTCSSECHYKLADRITKKNYEIRKLKVVKRKCKGCERIFEGKMAYKTVFCNNECQYKYYKEKRIKKGNPNYRSGLWSVGGLYYKNSKAAQKHRDACHKYRQYFLKENEYLFCERCKINQSFQFSTHHIIFASERPRNKELHNFRNLIMLCLDCHTLMHARKNVRNELVKERNLHKLFNLIPYIGLPNKTLKNIII